MAQQFVFTMQDLRKVVGDGRVILDGINLSFLPGAKIGVLGHNGAGKSTLLRIMAGVDTDFHGEARPASGLRVGYLPQEPELDPAKDVLGNVEEGLIAQHQPKNQPRGGRAQDDGAQHRSMEVSDHLFQGEQDGRDRGIEGGGERRRRPHRQ